MPQSPTKTEMERYIATAKKRRQVEQQQQLQRQREGYQIARKAAERLKERFQVKQVWLFGSMLTLHRIHPRSDIDLAVKGLDPKQYLNAVIELLDLSEFSVDLVQIEYAQPSLQKAIEQQGVEL